MACVGIDLGSTYCSVAVLKNETPEMIVNANGNRATPTCVAFVEKEILVGDAALLQAPENPENTITDLYSLLGTSYTDIKEHAKEFAFKVVAGSHDTPAVEIKGGKQSTYSGEELLGLLFKNLKDLAAGYMGGAVSEAVVAVPVDFTEKQRNAVRAAGKSVGLNIKKLLSEPIASAMAYDLDSASSGIGASQVLVMDVGGQTCNVSLLRNHTGFFEIVRSKSIMFGGKSVDKVLVAHFLKDFEKKTNVSVDGDVRAIASVSTAHSTHFSILHENIRNYNILTFPP